MEPDSDEIITDVAGVCDGAITGTVAITSDASGGGAANIDEANLDGKLILAVQNVPCVRAEHRHGGVFGGDVFLPGELDSRVHEYAHRRQI